MEIKLIDSVPPTEQGIDAPVVAILKNELLRRAGLFARLLGRFLRYRLLVERLI